MKRTGEREMLLLAFGLSFPRGESPTPITVIVGSTAFSASYDFASTVSYAAAETGLPAGLYCGSQNTGWFGSLPIT